MVKIKWEDPSKVLNGIKMEKNAEDKLFSSLFLKISFPNAYLWDNKFDFSPFLTNLPTIWNARMP